MKHRFILGTGLLVLVTAFFCPSAADAVVGDLIYGTTISNEVVVKYTDSVGSSNFDTRATRDTDVQLIAGDTMTSAADGAISGAGGVDTMTYTVYNTGNSGETFSVYVGVVTYSGGADTWDFRLVKVDAFGSYTTNVDSGANGGGTITIGPISEDGTATFAIAVRSDAAQANSPDGSSGTFNIIIENAAGETVPDALVRNIQYTGDNGNLYAEGDMHDSDKVAAVITAPSVTVTKTVAVTSTTAPTNYVIPGASLQYTIGAHNNGSGAAVNSIIFDTVPFTSSPGDLVELDTLSTASSWVAYWATDANAHRVYVGSPDTYWHSWNDSPPGINAVDTGLVRFVKWEKASFAATTSETQTFTVTVN